MKKGATSFLHKHIFPMLDFQFLKKDQTIKIGDERIKLKLEDDLPNDRTRINCTMPIIENKETVAWRWFGMLLTKANNKVR